jgi:DNA integrity scanning protein DisA with diadenylate cyclase activity
MTAQRSAGHLEDIPQLAVQMAKLVEADAILLMIESPLDLERLKKQAGRRGRIIVAGDGDDDLAAAKEAEMDTVLLNMAGAPVHDKLTQALLGAVANEMLAPGADVIALYSGFEAGRIDSISHIRLDEHLGRLTARDLRKLETNVPLETLKTVMDLAVEIGHEGREGKPVGTILVVGDCRNVMTHSEPLGFDPVKGYNRKDRNLQDHRVREAIKEIAPLDGAILVAGDGTVEAACRYLNATAANVTLSKGLGARHWAAAAITKKTKAVAVTVSESNGTVRLFHKGEVLLRVEPFRRAMKWREFEYDPPTVDSE